VIRFFDSMGNAIYVFDLANLSSKHVYQILYKSILFERNKGISCKPNPRQTSPPQTIQPEPVPERSTPIKTPATQ
jgi:hypothetical protein